MIATPPAGPQQAIDAAAAGTSPGNSIRIEHLTHRYTGAETDALDALSLTAPAGRLTALLGPNGSGKSTLMRILSTRLAPSARTSTPPPTIDLGGVDPLANPGAARARIGVVFQNASVDDRLTAAENLTFQGRLYGLGGVALREAVAEGLRGAGLVGRGRDRVGGFSGGMRRRLEIAKAAMHRPAVLLMDEPATGLDPEARAVVRDQLDRLCRAGTTVLMSTHLMAAAEDAAQVIILCDGRTVASGSPAELRMRLGVEVLTVEPAAGEAEPLEQALVAMAGRGRVHPGAGGLLVAAEHSEAAAAWLHRLSGELRRLVHRVTWGPVSMREVYRVATASAPAADTSSNDADADTAPAELAPAPAA